MEKISDVVESFGMVAISGVEEISDLVEIFVTVKNYIVVKISDEVEIFMWWTFLMWKEF